jgi:glyoxylase-like metal-dependent hydrolase (beta-lactamase superfamily II)/8-oxo-dGTP pyrophosphatase MutT (NUDIX family)
MSEPAPKPRFKESAAVILVRGAGRTLETYWVKRSDRVSYMPGFEAFLGGKVNPEDVDLPVAGAPEGAERVMRACALREAFEEAGVLLATAGRRDAATLADARRRLLAGDATFPALAHEHGWTFDAASLAFAGRWQTPPFASQRFETMFYVARVPEGQDATVRVGELASGEWVRPHDAIAEWQKGARTFAAPILYSMIALAEAANEGGEPPLAALAERLLRGPEQAGTPTRRIELKWGIVLHGMRTRPLPPATHTNAYLVGEREMALIDPGSGEDDEVEALFQLIEALEADGRRLQIVLLTHHHPDHVGGVAAVRAWRRVKVAGHADLARHVKLDLSLKDGDWIPLAPGKQDWTLRALATPGHTRDHLCYTHPRTRSLFTGDLIPGGQGTVIIDPPDGDMAAYLESLERLKREDVETLWPGHGSPQGGAMRRIDGLIAHRREREVKVLVALERTPRPLEELVPRVYADTPRELWPYAERSLLAHLIKLETEGRARREGERWAAGGSDARLA